MADPMPLPPPTTFRHRQLLKHGSWSPDIEREETWERRMDLYRMRRGRRAVRSVTEDDFDELRGCIDLGIVSGDGSLEGGDYPIRIAKILPALNLYLAVQRGLSGPVPASTDKSPAGSSLSIFASGSSPSEIKANLKQWAQVVACSLDQRHGVRRYSGE